MDAGKIKKKIKIINYVVSNTKSCLVVDTVGIVFAFRVKKECKKHGFR